MRPRCALAGWPFVLKDGVATDTDPSCDTPARYMVRSERGGYAFDFKSGGCPENATSLGKLLFVADKPKQ